MEEMGARVAIRVIPRRHWREGATRTPTALGNRRKSPIRPRASIKYVFHPVVLQAALIISKKMDILYEATVVVT